jgi:hypothetical protein
VTEDLVKCTKQLPLPLPQRGPKVPQIQVAPSPTKDVESAAAHHTNRGMASWEKTPKGLVGRQPNYLTMSGAKTQGELPVLLTNESLVIALTMNYTICRRRISRRLFFGFN